MRIAVGLLVFVQALHAYSADAWSLALGKFDATSRIERAEVARSLVQRIQKLAQFLPTQSPRELAWLDEEQRAIDGVQDSEATTSRTLRLWESPERQHKWLHETLASVRDALLCAADHDVSAAREVMCWSVASYVLTDQSSIEDAILILSQAGRLPKDVDKQAELPPKGLGYGRFYNSFGRGIQQYIVIPYLKREAARVGR